MKSPEVVRGTQASSSWIAKASTSRLWFYLSSFCLASGVMFYDYIVLHKKPITKWPVDLSAVGLLRSVVICSAAYLLVKAVRPGAIEQYLASISDYLSKIRLDIAFTLTFFAVTVLMVLVDPKLARSFANEDGIIENMSAIFLLIAALLIFASLRYAKHLDGFNVFGIITIPSRVLLIIVGIVFLTIFFEEISWGQRILGFQTPLSLLSNDQKEFNFHNFNTWLFENLYYATAFSVFVLLPYAAAGARERWRTRFGIFVPAPEFVVIAAPVAFLQAEMWNNVPVQGAAWATFFILIDLVRVTQDRSRYLILFILIVCALGQAVFLLRAGQWLTEYKEAMIAFLCLAYAGMVVNLARRAERPE